MSEAMLHICRLTPGRPGMMTSGLTPDERRIVGEHFGYLTHAAERAQVLLFGRTQESGDATFGIILLNIADRAAAERFVAADPAVKSGVMRAEIFPFAIAGMAHQPWPAE